MKLGLFHCPACGCFNEAEIGESVARRCVDCDFPLDEVTIAKGAAIRPTVQTRQSGEVKRRRSRDSEGGFDVTKTTEELREDKVKLQRRRKKQKLGKWSAIVGIWIVTITMLVVWKVMSTTAEEEPTVTTEQGADSFSAKVYVQKNIAECYQTLENFLKATTAAEKGQLVINSQKLAPVMRRYYDGVRPSEDMAIPLKASLSRLIELPGNSFRIESRWVSQTGEKVEAIFAKEKGEWKLDWEHFVRFGTESLPLFTARKESAEGVFRVYMREKASSRRRERGAIKLGFVVPRIIGETSLESSRNLSEAMIDLSSPLAVQLLKILDVKKEDRVFPFGMNLPVSDNKALHRVRVKLRVKPSSEAHLPATYDLLEVQAGHWLGNHEPSGLEGKDD